jgi:hypothetical protein
MRLLGRLENGIQEDIFADIDPGILNRYLGVDIDYDSTIPGTYGAGALPEDVLMLGDTAEGGDSGGDTNEDDVQTHDLSPHETEIVQFLRSQLADEREKHVRHPPVPIPQQQCPFTSTEELALFLEAFQIAEQDGFVPAGYGVLEDEWEEGSYPGEQYIGSDRKLNPSLFIPLPPDIWFPRAVGWAVALHVMNAALNPVL